MPLTIELSLVDNASDIVIYTGTPHLGVVVVSTLCLLLGHTLVSGFVLGLPLGCLGLVASIWGA